MEDKDTVPIYGFVDIKDVERNPGTVDVTFRLLGQTREDLTVRLTNWSRERLLAALQENDDTEVPSPA